jgi:hypothetical protein
MGTENHPSCISSPFKVLVEEFVTSTHLEAFEIWIFQSAGE